MSMNQIIQDAVALIPNSEYMRASDYEANIEVDNVELKGKTLAVYNNLPTLNYPVGVVVEKQWPVSVKLLQLVDTDANTVDEDIIREALVPVAEKLFRDITANASASKSLPPSSYTIRFLGVVYDGVMTGVELAFTYEFNPIC